MAHDAAATRSRDSPLLLQVEEQAAEQHVRESVDGLRENTPALSAATTLSRPQRRLGAAVLLIVLLALVLRPAATGTVLASGVTVVYAAAATYRVLCFRRGIQAGSLLDISDEQARAAPDRALPHYTVLVPAYREPEVIGRLLESLEALEYPRDRLEVLVLLELDDDLTLRAVERAQPPDHVRVVLVPAHGPKTKPKACNYGLRLSRGSLVTIYDAEDRPEPLQLRRAAVAFGLLPAEVACLQAQLTYFNTDQNRLTKWFTAEYVTWFEHFLPGLVSLRAPVPLGGTSNHMQVDVLLELGGWDPYNVTEDADLGIRLHRAGYHTRVLRSVTLEEANSDAVNWLKQRSRWYKGYLQTLLVHLRSPRQLRRELGWRGLTGFLLFVGGTPVLAMLNPLFWSLSILWLVAQPEWLERLFPAPWYHLALASWLLGNAAMVYLGVLSMRIAHRDELVLSSLLAPAYWLLMAVAALKAAMQLVRKPSFWEKTTHGLDVLPAAVPRRRRAPLPSAG